MAPARDLELERGVLQRGMAETVGIFRLETIDISGIPLERDVPGELRVIVLAALEAIVVIATASDERDLAVQPFQ